MNSDAGDSSRNPPRVSVLVTCFNLESLIESTLDAVRAQGLPDLELLIADDASSDASVQRIESWIARTGYPARLWVNEQNQGVNRTLDALASSATGTYLLLLDGDDVLLPGGLDRLATVLDRSPDAVAFVYGDAIWIDDEGALISRSFVAEHLPTGASPYEGRAFHHLLRQNILPSSATLVRRRAFLEVGGIDPNLSFQDWDLWLRLADRFELARMPESVVVCRSRADGMERSSESSLAPHRSLARFTAKWLDRDPVARELAAVRIRRSARVIAPHDRHEARELLRSVASVPSPPEDRGHWALLESALLVPGVGRALPLTDRLRARCVALIEAERGAWRSGRRLPRSVSRSS